MPHVMLQADWDRLLALINSREVYRTGQNGTSVYLSGTTLTLAAMPFTPLDAEFRAVLEYNAGGPGQDQITIYWADEHPMHLDAGVLTVQNATFNALSTFRVFYTGLLTTPLATAGHDALLSEETKAETVMQLDPWKLNATVWVVAQILAGLGQGGIWISPKDYTATRTGATTLALANIVGVTPGGFLAGLTDVQIRAVLEWDPTAGTFTKIYSPEAYHFDWTNPTLTVTGANFGATSQFMVVIADQQKAIGWHNAVAVMEYGNQILGRVLATGSLPTIADGRMAFLSLSQAGLMRNYERPPNGGLDNVVTCSATVGTAVVLGGAQPCRLVEFRVDPAWPANDIIVVGFDGTLNALINASGVVQKGVALRRDDGWCPTPIWVDNVNLLYAAASAASVKVHWRATYDPS